MLIKPVPIREVSKLLKTGQTTSYAAGDDGDLQKGIAKEYLVLDAGQYAGTTNITLNAKTDVHSNNCVLDLKTGLMWSRYVSASVGPGADGKLPWTVNVNGEGIFEYCMAANAAGLGGFTDWRIPSAFELFSLANLEKTAPGIDQTVFLFFPTGSTVWTGSTLKAVIANAWTIVQRDFNQGNSAKTNNFVTLLVRGGD